MNYAELIKATAEKTGQSQVDTRKVVDTLFDTIKEEVQKGEPVKVHEFGTFDKVTRKERNGINPSTKESIIIPERDAVRFKANGKFLG